MLTITAPALPEHAANSPLLFVIASAPGCKHCLDLEADLPTLMMQHPDVSIVKMDVTDSANAAWLQEQACDSTPFVYVFVKGSLVGGDNFSSATLPQLIQAIKEMNAVA